MHILLSASGHIVGFFGFFPLPHSSQIASQRLQTFHSLNGWFCAKVVLTEISDILALGYFGQQPLTYQGEQSR
jgi:hypothetical protein